MLPRIQISFERGGLDRIALLGPFSSDPDLPVQGIQLSAGMPVQIYEDLDSKGEVQANVIVAGWNEQFQSWFAKYDLESIKWKQNWNNLTRITSFEEWITHLFDRPIDENWWANEETDWNELTPLIVLDYMTRLFNECGHILKPYSDAQIDQGLWFLVGGYNHDHPNLLKDAEISWPIRLECIRSILHLFNFFAARCTPHLSHLDEQPANPLNSICYMFWDILRMRGHPGEADFIELDAAILEVMTAILQFPSDACRESALHGLGHWQINYPKEVDKIVAEFISRTPNLRPELRDYALSAEHGMVL